MKKMWLKATQMIFAYGMSILLVVCFLAALFYIAAIVIGQPVSVRIHEIINGYVFPPVYYAGILLSFDGLIHLYLKGDLLFRLDLPKKPKRTQESNE